MYKVLVTTVCHYVGSGTHAVGVHTLVIEFETRPEADTAFTQVNANAVGVGIMQMAKKLYF